MYLWVKKYKWKCDNRLEPKWRRCNIPKTIRAWDSTYCLRGSGKALRTNKGAHALKAQAS